MQDATLNALFRVLTHATIHASYDPIEFHKLRSFGIMAGKKVFAQPFYPVIHSSSHGKYLGRREGESRMFHFMFIVEIVFHLHVS
jgi:hypothetical protein